MSKKLHYYSYAFVDNTAYASVYIGYEEKYINHERMNIAKVEANISESAVLLNCSYLGYMSKEEFKEE